VSNHSRLSALESRLRDDFVAIAYPDVEWVRPVIAPDGGVALNCAVIGAGQMGMTVAAGLKRELVANVVLFDRAAPGLEGPWLTFGRMQTLRTPKYLTGPELGLPSLGFRAWWIALHGQSAWDSMTRIPRTAWMEYLIWYRRVMDLDVRNHHVLTSLRPVSDNMFRLEFATPEGQHVAHARTLVLATGTEGGGGHIFPEPIASHVPAHLRAHTNDDIDLAKLRGKRVGILGAGASAFDIAIAALDAGATSVDLCFRRPRLPEENPRRWMETAGFLPNFSSLPDAKKWSYLQRLYSIGQPPPLPTFQRAASLPGFRMQPGTPWERCLYDDSDTITVESGDRRFTFDFVIAGTGISADLAMRPEFNDIRSDIALWSDRYDPPPGLQHPVLGRFPYLGPFAEFTAKVAGTAPYLSRIHFLGRTSTLSLGAVAASNSALKYIGPLAMRGVTRTLMLDQSEMDWNEFITRRHEERAPQAEVKQS
jgi:cation diffusion facilitator CzcD-associated flavoprotein CzcO